MNRRTAILFLSVVMVALIGLPLFMRPAETRIQADRELVLLSPHWEGIIHEFNVAFHEYWKKKTGESVALKWLDLGGTSDALRFVMSEFSRTPEGIGVDVFWGGGSLPYSRMDKKGLLARLDLSDDVFRRVPPTLFGYPIYNEKRTWVGTALSGFGMIYNRKVLSWLEVKEPSAWADLSDPALFGWVGSGDPANSGSAHVMYEIILQAYGFERGMRVITLMGANARRFEKHSSHVISDVSVGEVAVGLSIDFYAGAAIASAGKENLGFVYPEKLTVINPDPIGILKGAPHPDLAKAFVEFVLSEQGQRLWILPAGSEGGPKKYNLMRVPVVPEVFKKYKSRSALSYDPFSLAGTINYDAAKGSLRWTILNDFLRAAVIDTHGALVEAWKRVRRLPSSQRDKWIEEMSRPLLSEEEMLELAREKWSDSEVRNDTRSKWTIRYRERYERIARLLDGGAGF